MEILKCEHKKGYSLYIIKSKMGISKCKYKRWYLFYILLQVIFFKINLKKVKIVFNKFNQSNSNDYNK